MMSPLKLYINDFLHFGIKQAYACLFGGALLFFILLTSFVWQPDWPIARYDALFIIAIAIQCLLLAFKLETWDEAKIILIFHIVGTVMEIFKTTAGSWAYPEVSFFKIGEVPLFSGFMYSAVGSYIARVWRIFDFRFIHYPPKTLTFVLCALVYINFFTHHYIIDMRTALFAFTALLFARTRIYFKPNGQHYWMPLLVGFVLVAFFIWIAENVSTFGSIWVYPNQSDGWKMVSFSKMGSWFLLMIISFVLVTCLHPIATYQKSYKL